MANWILGLTGGIGSGKSMASRYFEQQGIECIDADQIARDVVQTGTTALNSIIEHFGTGVLLPNGQLNRAQLRSIIFSDPAEKQWLEQLLHPLIQAETERCLHESQSAYTVLVSPLLFEQGRHQQCDRTLLIDAPEQLQRQRTMVRDGTSSEQVESIMSSQWTRAQRRSMADDVLLNDQGPEQLYQQLKVLHKRYVNLALKTQR